MIPRSLLTNAHGGGGGGSVSPWRDPRKAAMLTGTVLDAVLCAASGFATSYRQIGSPS